LSAALKAARTRGSDDHGNPMALPTKPLVGVTRQEILLALGPPTHECSSQRDVAGCTRRGTCSTASTLSRTTLSAGDRS
jgi:hypothetical protein